jgi:multidrug resistance protein, MATE family
VFVTLNSAVSRPQFTMAINVTALLLKIPLNALFIWGAGPIPALGGAGCAVASACLSWLTFALGLAFWLWHPYLRAFHAPGSWRPLWRFQKELLRIGVPAGLGTMFEVTSFTLMAVLMARLGAATLSGHQIVGNLTALLFMVPLSISFASGALVAQALGAHRADRARTLSVRALRLAIGAGIAMAITTWFARDPILRAYTSDAQTLAAAQRLIALALGFHVFDALQNVSVFLLRSYKVTLVPMLIYAVSLWGIGLGGGYLLAYRGLGPVAPMGSTGLWSAALAGLGLAATALAWLTLYVSGAKQREQAQPAFA